MFKFRLTSLKGKVLTVEKPLNCTIKIMVKHSQSITKKHLNKKNKKNVLKISKFECWSKPNKMEALMLCKQSLRGVCWGLNKWVFGWTWYIETFFIRIWISKEPSYTLQGKNKSHLIPPRGDMLPLTYLTWQLRWCPEQH